MSIGKNTVWLSVAILRNAGMSINFDKALGIHEQSLLFRGQRAAVLANNIANADTPNFKARDLDFAAVLQAEQSGEGRSFNATQTHSQHMNAESLIDQAAGLRFRTPLQPAVDGNTVDSQAEQAQYADNAIRLQASFTFLNSKFSGLMTALRGE